MCLGPQPTYTGRHSSTNFIYTEAGLLHLKGGGDWSSGAMQCMGCGIVWDKIKVGEPVTSNDWRCIGKLKEGISEYT